MSPAQSLVKHANKNPKYELTVKYTLALANAHSSQTGVELCK